jgi:hypothetical protein
MRHVCVLLMSVMAVTVMSGCARLFIEQYTFQGDAARGEDDRIAVAKGIRKAILAKLKYAADTSQDATAKSMWQALERLDPPAVVATTEAGYREAVLDSAREELFEFASRIERIPEWGPFGGIITADVKSDARQIKSVIRFSGFDQIDLRETDNWRSINPVKVFGGFGKTEYIVVRDDGGNYELKSGGFDPSKVIAAGVNAAVGVMKIVAAAYGVPLTPPTQTPAGGTPANGSATASFDPRTSPSLEAQTRLQRDVARRLDTAADLLRQRLQAIQDTRLSANATDALDEARTKALTSDLRAAIDGYRSAVAALSRGVSPLSGLESRLPQFSPSDRLASLFGVGAFTDAQQVALYWAYRVNPDTNDPREEALITKTVSGLVAFDTGRPKPRDGLSAAAVAAALDDLDRGGKLKAGVDLTRAKLAAVKAAWGVVSSYNAMVKALKPVFAAPSKDSTAMSDQERKERAAALKAAVTDSYVALATSPPNLDALKTAEPPADAVALPASALAKYKDAFAAIKALPETPSAGDLQAAQAKLDAVPGDPVALPPLPSGFAAPNLKSIETAPAA